MGVKTPVFERDERAAHGVRHILDVTVVAERDFVAVGIVKCRQRARRRQEVFVEGHAVGPAHETEVRGDCADRDDQDENEKCYQNYSQNPVLFRLRERV